MKEHPTLFSAPMIKAILDGRKTQTRRLVKPHPSDEVEFFEECEDGIWLGDSVESCDSQGPSVWHSLCPYGKPGDRIWVRETWRPRCAYLCGRGGACDCGDLAVYYEADGARRKVNAEEIPDDWRTPKAANRSNVSPLFMPRWASRITLEVTEVRVQRLQEISEEDAAAEGVEPHPAHHFCNPERRLTQAFATLWDSINGKRASWASNPFVWAISFKRVTT